MSSPRCGANSRPQVDVQQKNSGMARKNFYMSRVSDALRFSLLSILLFTGCSTARNVASSTFRVIDTPRRYIREQIAGPEETTTTTTTTTTQAPVSDVAVPGRPVAPPSPRSATTQSRTTTQQSGPTGGATPTSRPSPAQAGQFPVAKPVPGRPGYVYSVDPNGGIVDVTGYKSGDRAKDPYTKQIFIVP